MENMKNASEEVNSTAGMAASFSLLEVYRVMKSDKHEEFTQVNRVRKMFVLFSMVNLDEFQVCWTGEMLWSKQ